MVSQFLLAAWVPKADRQTDRVELFGFVRWTVVDVFYRSGFRFPNEMHVKCCWTRNACLHDPVLSTDRSSLVETPCTDDWRALISVWCRFKIMFGETLIRIQPLFQGYWKARWDCVLDGHLLVFNDDSTQPMTTEAMWQFEKRSSICAAALEFLILLRRLRCIIVPSFLRVSSSFSYTERLIRNKTNCSSVNES